MWIVKETLYVCSGITMSSSCAFMSDKDELIMALKPCMVSI